jgi:hypothetical protein
MKNRFLLLYVINGVRRKNIHIVNGFHSPAVLDVVHAADIPDDYPRGNPGQTTGFRGGAPVFSVTD